MPEFVPSWDLSWELVRFANRDQIEAVFVNGALRLWKGWPLDWDARALMREVAASRAPRRRARADPARASGRRSSSRATAADRQRLNDSRSGLRSADAPPLASQRAGGAARHGLRSSSHRQPREEELVRRSLLPGVVGSRGCPVPEGPLYTAENATRCMPAGARHQLLARRPLHDSNAYRYDKAVAPRCGCLRRTGRGRSSVWVVVQRRWVYLQGCVPTRAGAALEGGAVPDVTWSRPMSARAQAAVLTPRQRHQKKE